MNHRLISPLLALFALLLAIPAAATAQTSQPARQGAGRQNEGGRQNEIVARVRGIVEDLKLTDEQKAKVDDALQQARQELRGLMQAARDLPPAERREKLKNLVTDIREQISGILSDEQRATFRQKIDELAEQVAGARGGARAGDAGATQPGPGAARGDEPGPIARRLRDAVARLDLTDEQKQKVETVLSDLQQKARDLRREAQGDAQAVREKGRQLLEESRDKLKEILSPDQQAKLRELLQQRPGAARDAAGDGRRNRRDAQQRNANPPATSPATQPADKAGGGKSEGKSEGGGGAMAPPAPTTAPPTAAPPIQPSNERLAVGQPAPAFELTKLDGTPVQLASFQGQRALIAFGSYTSPSFRQRILALEDLRREFGQRIGFLIIYTREAHPAGTWDVDRNRDQQISIADHKDLAERLEAARQAQRRLKINIRIAADTMDDAAARAYHAWPNNAAVLLDRDGTILLYQQWFDAYGMKQAIQQSLSNSARPAASSSAAGSSAATSPASMPSSQ